MAKPMHEPAQKSPSTGTAKGSRPKGKQGRPMKRKQDLQASRKEVKRQQRALHDASRFSAQQSAAATTLSALERLPTEIIQHIFFLSLEANLAVTSRTLNTALSDESIFRTLILFAFFQPDGVSPVEKKHFAPADYRYLDLDERKELQRTIWGFKWCNKQRIEACMPILCRLAMFEAWHREKRAMLASQSMKSVEGEPDPDTISQDHVKEKKSNDRAKLPDLDDEEAMKLHFINPLGEDEDDIHVNGIRPTIRVWSQVRYKRKRTDTERQTVKIITGSVAVIAPLFIPNKVLRGSPWTSEKVLLFRLLSQGWHDTIRADSPFPGAEVIAVIAQGMESAIEDQRLDVLNELLRVFTESTLDGRHSRMSDLPSSVLLAALKLGEQGSDFVESLDEAGIELTGDVEEAVTAWALQATKRGDPLGKRLLRRLEG